MTSQMFQRNLIFHDMLNKFPVFVVFLKNIKYLRICEFVKLFHFCHDKIELFNCKKNYSCMIVSIVIYFGF